MGIEPLSVYPYTAKNGQCKYSKSQVVFQNKGLTMNPKDNNLALQGNVVNQPVAIGIDASLNSFANYHSGVYNPTNCASGPDDIDHCVLIVGYGV